MAHKQKDTLPRLAIFEPEAGRLPKYWNQALKSTGRADEDVNETENGQKRERLRQRKVNPLMYKRLLITLQLVAVMTITASVGRGQGVALSPDLAGADENSQVNVIVRFKQPPSDADYQRILRLHQLAMMRMKLRLVKGGAFRVPAAILGRIAADSGVAYVSADRPVTGMLDLSAAAVNATAAWSSGWDGSGVGVAVIDSGLIQRPDFLDSKRSFRIVYGQDFTGSGSLQDQYGHGTHVAGIIAGNGALSTCSACTRTFKGIAPNANLIDLRVLDENGQSSDSTVIQAIDTAIQLKDQYNIRVINLSLGRPVFESYTQDPLCQAVEAAWKAGIVVVVAAGNDGRDNGFNSSGYGTIGSPANDPYVITVGAMKTEATPDRSDDVVATYSSKGPTAVDQIVKPDIVAPGNTVVSLLAPGTTLPTTYPLSLIPLTYYLQNSTTAASPNYFSLSGTSMATPVVSGAVADLLEANPDLTPDQVKARLMKTAYKTFPASSTYTDPATGTTYVDQYDAFTIGAGYLDLQSALNETSVAAGAALSPLATWDPVSGNAYVGPILRLPGAQPRSILCSPCGETPC